MRIDTLTTGAHFLTASDDGDGKFGGSTSATVAITIANADFSLDAAPVSATVIAGQSTQFMLTISPSCGFTDNVTLSCAPVTAISCAFNPATITLAGGAASTTLTVSTLNSVSHYGLLMPGLVGPCVLLVAVAWFSLVMRCSEKLRTARASLVTATAVLTIVALGLAIGGCGGYGSGMQSNRGTASIIVTARSGAISHTATLRVTVR